VRDGGLVGNLRVAEALTHRGQLRPTKKHKHTPEKNEKEGITTKNR